MGSKKHLALKQNGILFRVSDNNNPTQKCPEQKSKETVLVFTNYADTAPQRRSRWGLANPTHLNPDSSTSTQFFFYLKCI